MQRPPDLPSSSLRIQFFGDGESIGVEFRHSPEGAIHFLYPRDIGLN
jgi:hypothetical protein